MQSKWLVMMGVALVSVAVMAQDDPWLSIAEYGASGSTFETTASAT